MKTELKELSATRRQIDIQIDAAAVRAAYDQISDRYAKAANVPGFRPGHAPRAVVRTRFKDQIRTEVLRELLPEAAQKAIEHGKADEMLASLTSDKDAEFYKLSRGHSEWTLIEQALRDKDKSKLDH